MQGARGGGSFLLGPLVAFWTGLTLLFLGAAGAAGLQFVGGLLRARGTMQVVAPIYLVWLLLSLFFIISALVSGVLSWLLIRRHVYGYYGSLVGAIGLLFLGPLVSVIPADADLIITASLALLPAIIILFTLGSGAAFEAS
jgi:hypothetical protein